MRLTGLAFEDWLEHAFGKAVRLHGNAWYCDDDHDWWGPEAGEWVAYLTRLFESPEPALLYFSDSQIAQGLTYLVNTMAVGDDGHLAQTSVPVEDRLRLIAAVHTFFAAIFAPRCTPHLSHRSEPGGPLNTVCYMWWDVFPSIGYPGDPHLDRLQREALQTMDRILKLDSIACQESALHGLGHSRRFDPETVEAIIDGFLARSPDLGPALATYARSARCGCVL